MGKKKLTAVQSPKFIFVHSEEFGERLTKESEESGLSKADIIRESFWLYADAPEKKKVLSRVNNLLRGYANG